MATFLGMGLQNQWQVNVHHLKSHWCLCFLDKKEKEKEKRSP